MQKLTALNMHVKIIHRLSVIYPAKNLVPLLKKTSDSVFSLKKIITL